MAVSLACSKNYKNIDEIQSFMANLEPGTSIIALVDDELFSIMSGISSGLNLKIVQYPVRWEVYGKSALHVRNQKAIDDCDYLVAFWDEKSPDVKMLISMASKQNKLKKVYRINNNSKQESLF